MKMGISYKFQIYLTVDWYMKRKLFNLFFCMVRTYPKFSFSFLYAVYYKDCTGLMSKIKTYLATAQQKVIFST